MSSTITGAPGSIGYGTISHSQFHSGNQARTVEANIALCHWLRCSKPTEAQTADHSTCCSWRWMEHASGNVAPMLLLSLHALHRPSRYPLNGFVGETGLIFPLHLARIRSSLFFTYIANDVNYPAAARILNLWKFMYERSSYSRCRKLQGIINLSITSMYHIQFRGCICKCVLRTTGCKGIYLEEVELFTLETTCIRPVFKCTKNFELSW